MSPRVVLSYRLVSGRPDRTLKLEPDTVELAGFACRLGGDRLYADAPDGVEDVLEARERLEPQLHAWALRLDLDCHWRVAFVFDGATITPAPVVTEDGMGPRALRALASSVSFGSARLQMDVELRLPQLHPGYQSTDAVELAVGRLHRVEDGREPITTAAYWFTTFLKGHYGTESAAARILRVSNKVIATMRHLATRQDPAIGRKVDRNAASLRNDDIAWLSMVMRELVRRLAAAESAIEPGDELTMDTVPLPP